MVMLLYINLAYAYTVSSSIFHFINSIGKYVRVMPMIHLAWRMN